MVVAVVAVSSGGGCGGGGCFPKEGSPYSVVDTSTEGDKPMFIPLSEHIISTDPYVLCRNAA